MRSYNLRCFVLSQQSTETMSMCLFPSSVDADCLLELTGALSSSTLPRDSLLEDYVKTALMLH